MGAVYDIYLTLRGIEDEDEIVRKTAEFVANHPSYRFVDAAYKLDENSTLLDALDSIFGGYVTSTYYEEDNFGRCIPEPDEFTAQFDAGYGWADAMTEWFEYINPALGVTSSLRIYPDEHPIKMIKWSNGEIVDGDLAKL